jgi:hypothetical protein
MGNKYESHYVESRFMAIGKYDALNFLNFDMRTQMSNTGNRLPWKQVEIGNDGD